VEGATLISVAGASLELFGRSNERAIAILWLMGMGRSRGERSTVAGTAFRALGLFLWLAGCSVDEGGSGADCVRSTECEMGLVCIEGTCSNDLSLIGDPGEVPELMPDGGMDVAMPDASDMMTMPTDAGDTMTMTSDAAVVPPADGG